MHTLISGRSGSGKTVAVKQNVERNERFYAFFDHHDDLALSIGDKMDGLNIPFVLTDLATNPIPFQLFNRSTDERENEETTRMALNMFAAMQGRDGLSGNPLIERWAINAMRLWMSVDVPQSWLQYVLQFRSPQFEYMFRECRNESVRKEFSSLMIKSIHQQDIQKGGSERMISRLFVPQLRLGTVDIADLIRQRTSLIVMRGNEGFISDEICTASMYMILSQIFRYAKKRGLVNKDREYLNEEPVIEIIIDEFTRSGLCGRMLASALAELRKFGVNITLISQDLDFGDWTQVILQNTERKEWFASSDPKVLDIAGKDIATRLFSHDITSHREEYDRKVINQGAVEEVHEERDRYMTLNDQILKAKQMVMNLDVGERIVTGDRENRIQK